MLRQITSCISQTTLLLLLLLPSRKKSRICHLGLRNRNADVCLLYKISAGSRGTLNLCRLSEERDLQQYTAVCTSARFSTNYVHARLALLPKFRTKINNRPTVGNVLTVGPPSSRAAQAGNVCCVCLLLCPVWAHALTPVCRAVVLSCCTLYICELVPVNGI